MYRGCCSENLQAGDRESKIRLPYQTMRRQSPASRLRNNRAADDQFCVRRRQRYSDVVVLWLFAIPGLVGLLLLIRGWRGCRIDEHPLCRKCGYDLIASATAVNCPECGRDLWLPKAIRVGHRRRGWAWLVIGGLILAAALGSGGMFVYAIAKGANFNRYKPLWLLAREADGAKLRAATAAQGEVFARLAAGRLSTSQIQRIIEVSLRIQVDSSQPWRGWRGDFIEQAWLQGSANDNTLKSYVRNAIEGACSLEIPQRVREGEMMWIHRRHRPMRAGRSGTFMVEVQNGPIVLEDGGTLASGGGTSRSTLTGGSSGHSGVGTNVSLPRGKYRASTECNVRVERPPQVANLGGSVGAGPIIDAAPLLDEWRMLLTAEFEVVAADADLVERVHDPAQAEAMRRSVVVERCMAADAASLGTVVWCDARIVAPPVDAAFDIFVRVGDREWPAGSVVGFVDEQRWGDAAAPTTRQGLTRTPRQGTAIPPGTERVDIVLRPNVRIAEQAGLSRMWEGEIVLSNMPLDRPRERP